MATVELDKINKVYENGFHAVQDLSIDVEDGEFLVLVGPSGCGKSTALRMVAGLEDISTGELRIGGRRVNDVDPQGRDIAMVFQSYALYPHMSVADNMAYGLKLRKMPKDQINERVKKAAEMLELTPLLDRKPKQLSGGQRQRVAMGRSIVREPQVFLMDEPLSNLDAKLRVQMRAEISAVVRALNTTTLYVTHDQTEAMTMGDRMAVMKAGILQQLGTPGDCYDSPHNIFVAQFVGSPPMNLVTGHDQPGRDGLELEFGGSTLQIPASVLAERPALRNYVGRTVALGVRSEDMEDATLRRAHPSSAIKGTVNLTEALGSEIVVHFTFPGEAVVTEDTKLVAEDQPEARSCTSSPTRACAGWRPSRRARACGWATTSRSWSTSNACTTSTPRRARRSAAESDAPTTADPDGDPWPGTRTTTGPRSTAPNHPCSDGASPSGYGFPTPDEPVVDHVVLRSVRDAAPPPSPLSSADGREQFLGCCRDPEPGAGRGRCVAVGDHVVEESEERRPEPRDVVQRDRLGVQAELGPGHDLDQLVEGAGAAGHRRST